MSSDGGEKTGAGIRQIVRLREVLQKWQSMTITSSKDEGMTPSPPGLSPAISRRLMDSYVVSESDEEGCQSPNSPPDVPKGYLAVYVGVELRRFVIPTSYLTHPVFTILLEKAEEEFGFGHAGALTLPCETETFKYLLRAIAHNH